MPFCWFYHEAAHLSLFHRCELEHQSSHLSVIVSFVEIGRKIQSKKISNDQELIQSDPISCPQNQKGNN